MSRKEGLVRQLEHAVKAGSIPSDVLTKIELADPRFIDIYFSRLEKVNTPEHCAGCGHPLDSLEHIAHSAMEDVGLTDYLDEEADGQTPEEIERNYQNSFRTHHNTFVNHLKDSPHHLTHTPVAATGDHWGMQYDLDDKDYTHVKEGMAEFGMDAAKKGATHIQTHGWGQPRGEGHFITAAWKHKPLHELVGMLDKPDYRLKPDDKWDKATFHQHVRTSIGTHPDMKAAFPDKHESHWRDASNDMVQAHAHRVINSKGDK
jgi:hypothetical protein